MPFNPKIHHRRSIRLKGYDYSKAGAYFITICCHEMKSWFGKVRIIDGEAKMELNIYGEIAYEQWLSLQKRFQSMELDVFQMMPNHMHGILVLNEGAGELEGAGASPARTVGNVVGAYKSLVANECLKLFKARGEMMGKLWHRNYYENIIRNEQAYERIYSYIINNPAKWAEDKFHC